MLDFARKACGMQTFFCECVLVITLNPGANGFEIVKKPQIQVWDPKYF